MASLDNTGPTTGKGAFFYIGAVTINEYNNPILGKPPDELTRKVSLNFQIGTGDRVIVTDDGFICLFNNSDEQVVYILNTIFASARLFWGIPLDIVRIGELCNFEWIQTSNLIRIVGFAYVERNMFSLQRDKNGETFEEWQIVSRKVVNQDEMAKIIHFAYWIFLLGTDILDSLLTFSDSGSNSILQRVQ